jgi:hypothetical protein
MHIENYLHRHQATHKFKEVEPVLPESYDATELHEVLTAAVCSLDLAGCTPTRITIPAIHAGIAVIDISVAQDNDFVFEEEYLANFATFCDDELATTDPLFDICILAIQQFQNSCYQRGETADAEEISTEEATLVEPLQLVFLLLVPGLILLNNAVLLCCTSGKTMLACARSTRRHPSKLQQFQTTAQSQ